MRGLGFSRFARCVVALALVLSPPAAALQKTRPGNPPQIVSEPPGFARTGLPFAYDVQATDPDPGDTLTYSLPKKPAGATIEPGSGLIQWTPTAAQLGGNGFRVVVTDNRGLTDQQEFTVVALHVLEVDPVESPTTLARITITGFAGEPGNRIEVDGGILPSQAFAGADRHFAANVTLHENELNRLFVMEVAKDGTSMPPVAAPVVHDVQAPNLFVDFPPEGAELTGMMTDVAGRVGDLLSGFMGLEVEVNGVVAEVDVGIGNNGTFLARDVPLGLGDNLITAKAVDALGNRALRQRNVRVAEIPMGSPYMVRLPGGNQQSAGIRELLPQPLGVQVFLGDDTPFANKIVTFEVTRSDGRLDDEPMAGGTMLLQVRTDAMGVAEAYWTLGSDAGCGNNRVAVRSTGIAGAVSFCASALPGLPVQINVGSGNNQRLETGAPAREPLRAWVSDGCNGVGGVDVTFTVVRGNGLVNGQTSVTVQTSQTGHAAVNFVLGTQPGNNVVQATQSQNQSAPATFIAFGIPRAVGQPTMLSGLVLNNASQPIGGATIDLEVGGVAFGPVSTGLDGRFGFEQITESGPAHLHVDGLTATHLGGAGGMPIPQGSFPGLPIEITIVPNAANTLPMPVLLPRLNPNNARSYDGTTDVELTVEGVEGLRMVVRAGSMTNPDGSVPGPGNPAILSLNQVHHDEVPMPMPDGAAPPFAWTLQPADATFDPPIEVHYPNMTGLPPGSIAYFLSFNHGTNRFEIVASGHVTAMGDSIVSDPGSGIFVSGWGCNCPPYSVTGDCCGSNDRCEECEDGGGKPLDCCDGRPYDPATQGCCDDAIYSLATQACCDVSLFGEEIYTKATHCCTSNSFSTIIAQKNPITTGLILAGYCATRVQNPAWVFTYDGCSLPISPGFDKDNPAGGSDTHFGNLPGRNGPCDLHDECYQTCSTNSNARLNCDNAMLARMRAVCNASSEPQDVVQNCLRWADVYYRGLRVGGAAAFAGRQREVCDCCQ